MTDKETLIDAQKWLSEEPSEYRLEEAERLVQWLLDYIEDMMLPVRKRPSKWKMFMGWLFG